MDFTKLNIEFANMQNKINEYNNVISLINNKIKEINKEISKYDIKYKNTNNKIEKEFYKLLLVFFNEEKIYLENLLSIKEAKVEDKK